MTVTEVAGAFLLGVVSASSLALGSLTARLWKPTNFVLGLLTAFGAGALLSAVTIDIIAPSVEHDEFGWLASVYFKRPCGFQGHCRGRNCRVLCDDVCGGLELFWRDDFWRSKWI